MVVAHLPEKRVPFVPKEYAQALAQAQSIIEQLRTLSGSWNPVELVSPTNLEAEQGAFLASHSHPVVFSYNATLNKAKLEVASTQLELLRKKADALQDNSLYEALVKKLLLYKIRDDFATLAIAQGLVTKDDGVTKEGLLFKYGTPDGELLTQAHTQLDILEHQNTHEVGPYDADAIKHYFERVLRHYNLAYEVIVSPAVEAIDVRDKFSLGASKIIIPSGKKISRKRLIALIAHEIEGHCLQASNAYALFTLGGGMLKYDEEVLYEGFAMRNYLLVPSLAITSLVQVSPFAGIMPLIADQALQGQTFREVFEYASELVFEHGIHTQKDEVYDYAWKLTVRVFRGHTDPSNTHDFAMTKDCGYLKGWLLCEELERLGYAQELQFCLFPEKLLSDILQFSYRSGDIPYQRQNVATKLAQTL